MSTRATVTIATEADRSKIATWARNVEPGTVVTFRKKSRSTEQSAKMWAMLNEVSEQVDWYGQKLDAEDWKDVFTASLRHARVVPGIDKGTYVPLGMRTSTMTIAEMSDLIELIYAFGAQPEHPVKFKEPKTDTNSEDAPPSSSDAGELASLPDEAGASSTPLPDAPASDDNCADLLAMYAKEILHKAANTKKTGKEVAADVSATKERWAKDFTGFPKDIAHKVEMITSEARLVFSDPTKLADAIENVAGLIGVDAEKIGER